MRHLEIARCMLETFGAETIAEDKSLAFVFILLFIKAGVVTMPEIIEMLRSDPTMAEFEAIAAAAWKRVEGGDE